MRFQLSHVCPNCCRTECCKKGCPYCFACHPEMTSAERREAKAARIQKTAERAQQKEARAAMKARLETTMQVINTTAASLQTVGKGAATAARVTGKVGGVVASGAKTVIGLGRRGSSSSKKGGKKGVVSEQPTAVSESKPASKVTVV